MKTIIIDIATLPSEIRSEEKTVKEQIARYKREYGLEEYNIMPIDYTKGNPPMFL